MNDIIVALITSSITLVGVLLSNQKEQAVTDTKLEALYADAVRVPRRGTDFNIIIGRYLNGI